MMPENYSSVFEYSAGSEIGQILYPFGFFSFFFFTKEEIIIFFPPNFFFFFLYIKVYLFFYLYLLYL